MGEFHFRVDGTAGDTPGAMGLGAAKKRGGGGGGGSGGGGEGGGGGGGGEGGEGGGSSGGGFKEWQEYVASLPEIPPMPKVS